MSKLTFLPRSFTVYLSFSIEEVVLQTVLSVSYFLLNSIPFLNAKLKQCYTKINNLQKTDKGNPDEFLKKR